MVIQIFDKHSAVIFGDFITNSWLWLHAPFWVQAITFGSVFILIITILIASDSWKKPSHWE